MNWIILGVVFILASPQLRTDRLSSPSLESLTSFVGGGIAAVQGTPLVSDPISASLRAINPFIKHWEPARFDRAQLEVAHRHHEAHRRRRRSVNYDHGAASYGPANVVRLSFRAHDRDFRLVLREDPTSVYAQNVQIENTEGPVDYDLSRVYTGVVEDDDASLVTGVLTRDALFDGTIVTSLEQYYIEPAARYEPDLLERHGIHTVIYKLSDVRIRQDHHGHDDDDHHHVQKEEGGPRGKNQFNQKSDGSGSNSNSSSISSNVSSTGGSNSKSISDSGSGRTRSGVRLSSQSASAVSGNEFVASEGGVVRRKRSNRKSDIKRRKRWLPEEMQETRGAPSLPLDLEVPYNDDFSLTRNHNLNLNFKDRIITRTSLANNNNNNNNNNGAGIPGTTGQTVNRNINSNLQDRFHPPTPMNNRKNHFLINTYNPNGDPNHRIITRNRNIIGNVYDANQNNGSNPNHKTHVEIITKNGSTKKNIIVNQYDPDVTISGGTGGNVNLNVRNELNEQKHSFANSLYDRKSTCMLYLQADHTFFTKMGSDEASIDAITRHVQRANMIYEKTDFNGDGKPDNITFMIKRIKVHNLNALKDPSYRFAGSYGVEKFLELFSEEDYDAFCLAYMFTYRDFEMGTLGLAWTGDLKNAGGVCEKNGHYRGSLKSLNTGIVTLLNYGKHVPPAVSHVTLAHEIGHNFGSPHDPEQCTPGGEDGNFIMFARATSGDKRNNNKFSPCSLKAIEPVLNAKARSAKGCFTEPQASICGNGVVEPGEQCDCGWEEDCKDSCCYPMSRHPRIDQKPCTLTPKSQCSPSQGPCCTLECTLKLGDKCREDNGCRDPAFCDGTMPVCPASVNKPNKTICNKEYVCYMGECTGSICLAYGLESCQCAVGPNDPAIRACELCCKQPGEDKPCLSSFEWNEPPFDVPDMYAKPGTPCNDYNGYCDVSQKCREVDPSGPLATLRKLLLSEESIASFKKWVVSNWPAVALVAVIILALLVLSAKLLGKRTSLKLKTVTIIHSATTETVRLPEDNNGVIVHTAVRTKVPLKKKVRGERSGKGSKTGPLPPGQNGQQVLVAGVPKQLLATANGPNGGVVTTAAAAGNPVTMIPSTSKDRFHLSRSSTNNPAAVVIKQVKRHVGKTTTTTTGGTDSPKKLLKKKKKRSSAGAQPGVPSDESPVKEPVVKQKKKKTKSKHKEVIDYSSRTDAHGHTNTFGKVHRWLLESPIVTNATNQFEHASKITNIMNKSQSTPEHLTTGTAVPQLAQPAPQQRSPKKTRVKTKSVGNINGNGPVVDVIRKIQVTNRRVSEEQIAYILRETAKALIYLHENHIIHRDVRGHNILLTRDGEVKLCDFGLSRDIKSTLGKRGTCIGSPCWMAPEIITSGKNDNEVYDNRSDVWALGITAIELGDGKPPFHEMHPTRIMFQIVRNPPPTLYRPANWTQNYNDFINECLEKNPDHRPFSMEIIEHPFLTELPENDYHIGQELRMLAESVQDVLLIHKDEMKFMKGALKGPDNKTEKMHVEDLAALETLSEETILDELIQRYKSGSTYTFVGDVLLSMNPNTEMPDLPRGFHSKYNCKSRSDNSPHIFAIADSAYQDMLHHEEPQHIIMSGESYSGKTTNAKLCMKHLAYLGEGNSGVAQKIQSGYKVLSALVNAGTPLNSDSTRAIVQTQMTFGSTGKLSGAIFWVYLLEKLRISSTNMNQSNFHIFYYFYDAMEAEQRLRDFSLERGRNYRYLRIPESTAGTKLKYVRDDIQGNVTAFHDFEQLLLGLEISPELVETFYRTLASVLLLGEVRFRDNDGVTELEDYEVVGRVANLLKLDEKKFQWALLNYCVIIRGSAERRRHSADEARDARDVLAATIYTRLVDWLVNTINHKMSFGRAIFGDNHSITITDHFGFECFHRNHIDQLVVNSLNEQMQYLYNQRNFVYEMLEQEEEQIPVVQLHFYDNKLAVDHLMNKPKGIFSFIDDASRGRHGQNYIIDSVHTNNSPFIKRASASEFSVAHYTGRITYDARDMADKNRDFIPPEMIETLRNSTEDMVKILFSNPLSKTGNLTMAAEETLGVHTQKSNKKKRWGAALVAEKCKVKKMMNTLSRGQYSQVHKMRTIANVYRATSLELIRSLAIGPNSGGTHFVRCIRSDLEYQANGLSKEMIRQQVRAMAVLDTAKARQKGFSHRIPFQEFIRRYQFLAFDFDENVDLTRDNCRLLLIRLKLEGWVIGKTKVFLKYYNVEYLSHLYETQVKKIIKVQSMMRAFLAKRVIASKLKSIHRESIRKRQIQDNPEQAATKIQTAFRGHMARKKYRPLINDRTGKLDDETAEFMKPFAYRWRKKSMYQILLMYRAARYQDLVNFSQQVHIYNQRFVAGTTTCSNCIMTEKIDASQKNRALLGPVKPSVWKLRFRMDEIPFFDTTYMCDPSSVSYMYTGNDSDTEDWDAPLRRRKNVSSEITKAVQRNSEDNGIANEPFHRDPSLPIKRLSPGRTVDYQPRRSSPIASPVKMSSVYTPVPYARQSIDDIRNKFSAPGSDEVLPKVAVYKKRQAPRAPGDSLEKEPSPPSDREINKSYKKRPAPQPAAVRSDYGYETKVTPTKINPIREMQMIGKKNTVDENDNSDDEPPFNFQGMLRKTNYNRASMKRTPNDSRMSVSNFDFDDFNNNNNNNNNGNSFEKFNRSEGNVVYQSNRPKSCQGIQANDSAAGATALQRKHSLSHDAMMFKESAEPTDEDGARAGPSRSHSVSPFDENRNNYVHQEIAPGIIIEGYCEDI